MEVGVARGYSCGRALRIATKKIQEVDLILCSADVLGALTQKAVTGCAQKACMINGMKVRFVSHISVLSLTNAIKELLGKFDSFLMRTSCSS